MSFIGGVPAGPGGGLRFSGQTRGRIQGGSATGVNYPSPFFDVAHTYLPATIKQLFRWCRYYFLTNPLINAVVFKLSEYPITDIVIDHESTALKKKWTEYFNDHLRFNPFRIEVGLDYNCYGSSCISLAYPFKKYLSCARCRWSAEAAKVQQYWLYTNNSFRLTCPSCGFIGEAHAKDHYFKSASGIKLIRWNPEDIEITYNDITGEATYYYTIPPQIRNDAVIGKKDVVQGVPQVFLQAMREGKGVIFSKDNFFHLKRPGLAMQDRGWGTPLLMPVLKDTFYLQVMKKAQEAILLEHIVPLRVLFPQAASGSSDPFTSVNLVDWRDQISLEIARWRHDNNYIPILPLPIGNQTIGGDGRALLLTQEIQTWSEQIINGMQVPIEFIKGGMSYAGTNVSLRMLENQFLGYLNRQKQLAKFIMKQVSAFLGWPEANIRFKPFKMADDLQRKAFLFQLNAANKVSDTTLLADSDLSQEEENEIMVRETDMRLEATKKQQLAMATVQGEAQLIMQKFQVKAQEAMQSAMMTGAAPGEPGGPEGQMMGGSPGSEGVDPAALPAQLQGGPKLQAGPSPTDFLKNTSSQLSQGQRLNQQAGVDLPGLAAMQARFIAQMAPDQQQMALQNLALQSPELAQLVQQMLSSMQAPGEGKGPQVDMRPMPNQLPERRVQGNM